MIIFLLLPQFTDKIFRKNAVNFIKLLTKSLPRYNSAFVPQTFNRVIAVFWIPIQQAGNIVYPEVFEISRKTHSLMLVQYIRKVGTVRFKVLSEFRQSQFLRSEQVFFFKELQLVKNTLYGFRRKLDFFIFRWYQSHRKLKSPLFRFNFLKQLIILSSNVSGFSPLQRQKYKQKYCAYRKKKHHFTVDPIIPYQPFLLMAKCFYIIAFMKPCGEIFKITGKILIRLQQLLGIIEFRFCIAQILIIVDQIFILRKDFRKNKMVYIKRGIIFFKKRQSLFGLIHFHV